MVQRQQHDPHDDRKDHDGPAVAVAQDRSDLQDKPREGVQDIMVPESRATLGNWLIQIRTAGQDQNQTQDRDQ